ncbi:MAG: tetratricopeptide repeat protein [Coleofasciculaceae cyanobacterium SM2_1_6]|nr:tetratricopeptide repeat protein [Coleofasciculaceae cyanobacterium SM2_1_6]
MINQILDKRYRIVKVLGMGVSGPVCLAVDTQDPDYPVCVVRQVRLPSRTNGTFSRIQFLLNTKTEALEKLTEIHSSPLVLDFFLENQVFYLIEEFLPGHPAVSNNSNGHSVEEDQGMQRLQEMLSMVEPIVPTENNPETNRYQSHTLEPEPLEVLESPEKIEELEELEEFNELDELDEPEGLDSLAEEEIDTALSIRKLFPEKQSTEVAPKNKSGRNLIPFLSVGFCLVAIGGFLFWHYQESNNKNIAQNFYEQGIEYLEQGNQPSAIQALSQSIQLNPQNVAAFGNRGNAYYDVGDYASALADYTKVIELQPDNLNAYYNRGLVYFDQGNYQGRSRPDYCPQGSRI